MFAETTVDQEKTEECENGDVEMNDCQSDQSEHESDEELEKAYKNVTVNVRQLNHSHITVHHYVNV